MSGGAQDLIAVLTADHRAVEESLRRLETLAEASHDDEAKSVADRLIIDLVQHSVAEEEHLYPAVRRHLPDGADLADRAAAEWARADDPLRRLELLDALDARFWNAVHTLAGQFRRHVAREEHDLFPRLREACPEGVLRDLGRQVRRAERTAPTRPHAYTPARPPVNRLLAPVIGLVDRLRDVVVRRGRR